MEWENILAASSYCLAWNESINKHITQAPIVSTTRVVHLEDQVNNYHSSQSSFLKQFRLGHFRYFISCVLQSYSFLQVVPTFFSAIKARCAAKQRLQSANNNIQHKSNKSNNLPPNRGKISINNTVRTSFAIPPTTPTFYADWATFRPPFVQVTIHRRLDLWWISYFWRDKTALPRWVVEAATVAAAEAVVVIVERWRGELAVIIVFDVTKVAPAVAEGLEEDGVKATLKLDKKWTGVGGLWQDCFLGNEDDPQIETTNKEVGWMENEKMHVDFFLFHCGWLWGSSCLTRFDWLAVMDPSLEDL